METASPTFDVMSSTMNRSWSHNSSSPALISPSIPAPPSPPRRAVVSSASEMPQKDIKAAVFSQHVASQHYIEHYRKSNDLLRQQHREERSMWEIERQELLLKVAELEAKITRITHLQGSDIPSIADKLSKYSIGSATNVRTASAPSSLAPTLVNKDENLGPSSTGLSGSVSMDRAMSKDRAGSKPHMQSIPEGVERSKSVAFAENPTNEQLNKELEGQVIPGELVDKNLDGVIIKASSLPIAVKKAILEDSHSGTPSPLFSPSPIKSPSADPATPSRPVTIEIPSTQKILQLPSRELYTHAAGHTPLARLADSPAESTGATTPLAVAPTVYEAEQEKPPLEPYPSTFDGTKPIRPPNERADSYFNVPIPEVNVTNPVSVNPLPPTNMRKDGDDQQTIEHAAGVQTLDDDPALKGPLNLPHQPDNPQEQKGGDFLSKLDERLTSLSKEQDISSKSSLSKSDDTTQRDGGDPPLRIKRSLNFGSAWGLGNAGRNA